MFISKKRSQPIKLELNDENSSRDRTITAEAARFAMAAEPAERQMLMSKRLIGKPMPRITLFSTAGRYIDLSSLPGGRTVIYAYPRTSQPGMPAPTGWDVIPGARGCTPQACAFRDHHAEIVQAGAAVFGLSTQATSYQREMAARLHLPFEVLSDENFDCIDALSLPTFVVDGMRLIERLTLIVNDGVIENVFHPIDWPEKAAEDTLSWLSAH